MKEIKAVLVTHNPEIARLGDAVKVLSYGRLEGRSESRRGAATGSLAMPSPARARGTRRSRPMNLSRMFSMQGWNLPFVLAGALTMLLTGCDVRRVGHAPQPGITPEEVRLLHPIGRYIYQHKELSAEQTAWIRTRFGERYLPPGGEVEYIDVQPDRNRGPHVRAYVFKARGGSSHGRFGLLVCQSGGKVNELYLVEGTTAEGATLDPSFLDQFAGMKAVDASGLDRLRPLPGRDDLSREVAEAIRRVLILGAALRL